MYIDKYQLAWWRLFFGTSAAFGFMTVIFCISTCITASVSMWTCVCVCLIRWPLQVPPTNHSSHPCRASEVTRITLQICTWSICQTLAWYSTVYLSRILSRSNENNIQWAISGLSVCQFYKWENEMSCKFQLKQIHHAESENGLHIADSSIFPDFIIDKDKQNRYTILLFFTYKLLALNGW